MQFIKHMMLVLQHAMSVESRLMELPLMILYIYKIFSADL